METVTTTCPYCGTPSSVPLKTPEDGKALTCRMCGAPLPYPEPKYDEYKWPCPYCGVENLLTATTCANPGCGLPLPLLENATEIRRKEIPCGEHPGQFAIARCDICEKYLCPECIKFEGKKHYCQSCLDKIDVLEKKRERDVNRTFRTQSLVAASAVAAFFVVSLIIVTVGDRSKKFKQYDTALRCYKSGFYDDAIEKFSALGTFNGADEMAIKVKRAAFEEELARCEPAGNGPNLGKAKEHYDRGLEYAASPEELASLNLSLARAYNRGRKYEDALTYYEKADGLAKLVGKDAADFEEAAFITYVEKGDAAYGEADAQHKRLDRESALTSRVEYARFYRCCRRANDAVEYYERAKALKPTDPDLAVKLARAKGKYEIIKLEAQRLETEREAQGTS